MVHLFLIILTMLHNLEQSLIQVGCECYIDFYSYTIGNEINANLKIGNCDDPSRCWYLVLLVPLFSRLYEEMKAFYGLDMEVPTSEMALVRDLSKWLKACSRKQKLIIVLDALNQLDDGSKEDGQYQGS